MRHKYRTSELNIFIGEEWAMNVLKNVADKETVYTTLLWLVETGDIKKHYAFKWLFLDDDITDVHVELVPGDNCRFVKEVYETTTAQTYGYADDCCPAETDFLSETELDGEEEGLTEVIEDLILRLEDYDDEK